MNVKRLGLDPSSPCTSDDDSSGADEPNGFTGGDHEAHIARRRHLRSRRLERKRRERTSRWMHVPDR